MSSWISPPMMSANSAWLVVAPVVVIRATVPLAEPLEAFEWNSRYTRRHRSLFVAVSFISRAQRAKAPMLSDWSVEQQS